MLAATPTDDRLGSMVVFFLIALAIITALLWVTIAYETVTMREVRRQIRSAHGHGGHG